MDKELETEFDVIVLGTGFTESLIASAAARIGKKVMHMDRNDYYGGQWASFSLTGLENWANELSTPKLPVLANEILEIGESLEKLSEVNHTYFGVKIQWHFQDIVDVAKSCTVENNDMCSSEIGQEASREELEDSNINVLEDSKNKIWVKDDLLKLTRKFNIDLTPKLLFARGPLVELLISSNVARYLEFKCTSRILTWLKSDHSQDIATSGKFVTVPCSRSDVFTTDVISLIEKRILMKFLQLCHSYEQQEEKWKSYSGKPFKEFLLSEKLTPTLIQFVMNAIGMVDETVETVAGLKKSSHFLNSLGRYGTMPFLFSMYGSGEMPQAFCRLCAVFEGVYILRKAVEGIILNEENNVVGILSEGQRFKCKNLVMNVNYSSKICSSTKQNCISRGIFVTDRTLMDGEKEHLTLFRMPVDEENHIPVTVLEVGPCTGVTAPGTYLVYFFCNGQDAEADFKVTQQRIFSEEIGGSKPNVLFSLYFNQDGYDASVVNQSPSNVHICFGPDAELDYDVSISQAKSIFNEMFPEAEFLPRAPDHDEIIFEGDTPSEAETFEVSSATIQRVDTEKESLTAEPKEIESINMDNTEDCNMTS